VDIGVVRPDPEVVGRAQRRLFSISDRLRILNEADTCSKPGEIGALLRREGLYASTLGNFRRQRDSGKLGADPAVVREKRLEKEAARQRDSRKIAALEAENKKLKILLELQKKVAELMNLSLDEPTGE
jgi:transposase